MIRKITAVLLLLGSAFAQQGVKNPYRAINASTVIDMVPIISQNGTSILPPAGGNSQMFQLQPVVVLSGTVTLDLQWNDSYQAILTAPAANSEVLEYLVDDQPIGTRPGDYLTCPDATAHKCQYNWDTTTVADGTHVLGVREVNGTGATWLPDLIRGEQVTVIIANHGLSSAPQTVHFRGKHDNSWKESPVSDTITSPASPPVNTTWPLTHNIIAPSTDPKYENETNWMVESLTEGARSTLYNEIPEFGTTLQGGIFVEGFKIGGLDDDTAEIAYPDREKHLDFDGGRDQNQVSAYSTVIGVPTGSTICAGSGYVGIDLASRVFCLGYDGSVTTIAGWKANDTQFKWDWRSEAPSLQATDQQRLITKGICVGTPCWTAPSGPAVGAVAINYMAMSTDLAIDPRNTSVMYIAAAGDDCIVMLDFRTNPVSASEYAGECDHSNASGSGAGKGYVDNANPLNARFNEPYSVVMDASGNLYVADFGNSAIRKIASSAVGTAGAVTTLAGGTVCGSGTCTPVPSQATVWTNRDTWSVVGPVALNATNAWIPYPEEVRLDSSGNVVLLEPVTDNLRLINTSNSTITRIFQFHLGSELHGWSWFDIDTVGTVGPLNDIKVVKTVGSPSNIIFDNVPEACNNTTCPPTNSGGFPGTPTLVTVFANSSEEFADGIPASYLMDPPGHYPWVIAISKTEGRFITAGYGTNGFSSWRFLQPGDPPAANGNFAQNFDNAKDYMWRTGTVFTVGASGFYTMPWGMRPSFSARWGARGVGHIMGQTLDDLVSNPSYACPSNYNGTTVPCTTGDANLASYIQSGMGSTVPRPEITGNDLRDFIYFIRSSTLKYGRSAPVPYLPTATSSDVTAPIISSVSAVRTGATSATVTYTTNEPTLGYVAWGTYQSSGTTYYHAFSQIESCANPCTYGTSHSINVTGLPNNTVVHYNVAVRDLAGNRSTAFANTTASPDATIGSVNWTQVSSAGGTLASTWPTQGGFTYAWYDPLLKRTMMFERSDNNTGTIYQNALWAYDAVNNNFTSVFPNSVSNAWLSNANIYSPTAQSSICPIADVNIVVGQAAGGAPIGTYYVHVTANLPATTVPSGVEYWPNFSQGKITTTSGNSATVTTTITMPIYSGSTWNVYVGTTPTNETLQASGLASGATWTMPNTGLVAGAALPQPRFPYERQMDFQGAVDTTRNRFYMLGGACNSGSKSFWTFDSSAWNGMSAAQKVPYQDWKSTGGHDTAPPVSFWTRQDYGLQNTYANQPFSPGANSPNGANAGDLEKVAAYVPALTGVGSANGDKLYVYGTSNGDAHLYQYDPVGNSWNRTPFCTAAGQPSSLDAGAMFWEVGTQKLYLFGGSPNSNMTAGGSVTTIWTWDPAGNSGTFTCSNWTQLAAPTVTPLPGHVCSTPSSTVMGCPPRGRFPKIAYDSSRHVFLMYVGGPTNTFTDLTTPQTWKYDPATNTWTELDTAGSGFTWGQESFDSSQNIVYDGNADAYVVTQNFNAVGKLNIWTLPATVTGASQQSQNFQLTQSLAGSGSGTVTSADGGINCGTTCSASYAQGTPVTLTAAPALGSSLTGWTVDGLSSTCPGTGNCVVTMNAAHSVTATFVQSNSPFAPAGSLFSRSYPGSQPWRIPEIGK